MSKLLTIEGIGPQEVELLEATGWADLRVLAKADVAVLSMELNKANAMLKLVRRTPDPSMVERWIEAAARMASPSSAVGGKANGKAGAGRKRGGVGRAKGGGGIGMEKKVVEEVESGSDGSGEGDVHGEEALSRLAGPVNYEADPEVLAMLEKAPYAVPIPARILADSGISPSEIAVAPLLNRALGDLEVKVYVEKPRRKPLPPSPRQIQRESAEVKAVKELPEMASAVVVSTLTPALGGGSGKLVASVRASEAGPSGKKGIDVARVKSIEVVQEEGGLPVLADSPVKTAMEDERIALLRAPRPETNANRKPGSKFYIRGVLHDRPLRVWFGGLITVLLQLTMPLGILAAPLLILSDQVPLQFSWVPKWLLVFPVALPVLGLIYVMVSTGAKCRVCGQRLYVPKQCLKNRKAHRLPYFGHIGALAMHVMVYRWFNCTFCGTSIRIKK